MYRTITQSEIVLWLTRLFPDIVAGMKIGPDSKFPEGLRTTVLRCLAIAVAATFVFGGYINAATIQISDPSTDMVTATDNGTSGGRFSLLSCTGLNESCTFQILAPPGFFGIPLVTAANIFEPGTMMQVVSDTFQQVTCPTTTAATCWAFVSDSETSLTPLVAAPIIEDPTRFQTVDTISYAGSSVTDTIQFQSDADVPEPSSAMGLGSALLVGAWLVRRRTRRAV